MQDYAPFEEQTDLPLTFREAASGENIVSIDFEKYFAFLEDTGMSPEEKRTLVIELTMILQSFVDLGFAIHTYSDDYGQIGLDSLEFDGGQELKGG